MSMSRTVPPSRGALYPRQNAEDDKKYKKALRFIYKYGQETNKLTDEAVEACKRQGINTDELLAKTVEDFAQPAPQIKMPTGKAKSQLSPMTQHHKAQLLESESNLAEVRLNHHENRRRRK